MDRIELKAAFTVDDAGAITGIAWPFGTIDRMGDEIVPGAFAKAAAPLPMLDNHDSGSTVGVWDSVTETGAGLEVKGRLLVNDVTRAREVRALVQAKAITGLSVGFLTKAAKPRKGGGRTITEVDLLEVSIVAVPANPGARIVTAKAAAAGKEPFMADNENGTAPDIAALETKISGLEEVVKGIKAPDLKAVTDRMDGLEAKINRGLGSAAANPDEAKAIEAKALNAFLRNGAGALEDADRKTLNLGSGATGGYVIAPMYSTTIIEKITEISPMRSAAAVMSIGTDKVYLPVNTTKLAGGWVTETGARPSSEPAFDQIEIPVYEHAVIVPVSNQLLEDSFIDLQGYIAGQIGTQFGKAESTAFVTGDGSGKPTGFLNSPTDFVNVTALQDKSDIVEQLINLYFALQTDYARRAVWMMNRGTMAIIRNALDTTTKGTLWSDSLANGTPPTLLGRPVVEAVDMPDFAPAVAADTYPIAFGDFGTGYQIVDRIGVQLMRDDYTGADNGIVKIRARRRVGGKVVQPEAIALMKSDAP